MNVNSIGDVLVSIVPVPFRWCNLILSFEDYEPH